MIGRPLSFAALAVAAAFGLAACGESSTTQTTTTTTETTHAMPTTESTTSTSMTEMEPETKAKRITIVVRDGKVVGGFVREKLDKGQNVVLVATWDEAGALHLHGYEKAVNLKPGVPGRIAFVTSLPGRFEVELHGDRDLQIAELTVSP